MRRAKDLPRHQPESDSSNRPANCIAKPVAVRWDHQSGACGRGVHGPMRVPSAREISVTQVFLSYARDDDEHFVALLHRTLTDAGMSVWWDRRSMPSRGLTFLREIRDAISGC